MPVPPIVRLWFQFWEYKKVSWHQFYAETPLLVWMWTIELIQEKQKKEEQDQEARAVID